MDYSPEINSADGVEDECPITLEVYQESGGQQPVKLPKCGHTFSHDGINMLIKELAKDVQPEQAKGKKGRFYNIRCPTCRHVSRIRSVQECKVDHEAIELLREQAAAREAQKLRLQQTRLAHGIGGESSNGSHYTHQEFSDGSPV